jgi:hypothetical protein
MNKLPEFHQTWYELYATEGQLHAYALYPAISNTNSADVQIFEAGTKFVPFILRSRFDVRILLICLGKLCKCS